MHLNFLDVLSNLVGLFLLIGVGYFSAKAGILPERSSELCTRLLMKITLPCTVFVSLLNDYDPAFLSTTLKLIGLGFILFPLNSLLAKPLARVFRVESEHRGVWEFAGTYCNNGFMGFPIALALFGAEGLAQAAIFGIPFNVLVYTSGVQTICRDTQAKQQAKFNWRTVLFTGVNLATALGLVFYFGRWSVPAMLLTPLTHLSAMTTPLSMIITGINLTKSSIAETFRCRDALTASLNRLLLMPMVSYLVLLAWGKVFSFDGACMFGVVFIIMCMPTAAACTSLSEMYGADREFAARCVFLSSLFCILSIPVMSLLL